MIFPRIGKNMNSSVYEICGIQLLSKKLELRFIDIERIRDLQQATAWLGGNFLYCNSDFLL
jgi:hypothetical protein